MFNGGVRLVRSYGLRVVLIIVFAVAVLSAFGCKEKKQKATALIIGTGQICGTVVDEDGTPIAGALVYVEGLWRASLTNEKGYYELTKLPSGTYTVVASSQGYRKAVRTNVSVSDGKVTRGVDLTLVRDPKYEPDTIRFVEVSPPEGSRIEYGKPIFIRGSIEYALRNSRWGTIYIFLVDEAGKRLVEGTISRISAMAGEHVVPFGRQVVIPQGVGERIWLVAALFAGHETSASAADTVIYSVGVIRDEVTFVDAEPQFGAELIAGERTKVKLKLRCSIESVDSALLKVELIGSTRLGRYTLPLAEKEIALTGGKQQAQEMEVELECVPTAEMSAIKARALLMTKEGKKTIAASWSPRFLVVTGK
jgi:hypothetical protein